MMEKQNHGASQEDYIWAMRTKTFRNTQSDMKYSKAQSAPTSLTEKKSEFKLAKISDDQTRVMASLVPDEVINNVNDYSHKQFDCCFLFGDVSGFTELCEKYNQTGVSGPSRMTQVLNKYLGSMVQEVMSYNGDVLKFSGDAFLAVFKTSETESMREVVHEAVDCALVIQKDYGSFRTDVGVMIRVRPAVNTAVRLRIKEALRRFIIAPVMKSIDMNEPFEYLTEMRIATIVFINVISEQLQTEESVILADETYKAVCSVVDKMNGCVNKVSLFDKDLMFVVIFGLRGLKHELECQVALRCARQCHTAIDKLPNVLSTSIGVTTGKTYCGVFGHTLRREYTVISLIVNKAARLMVAYKGKVTCDRETFLHSKLEAKHFILQPYMTLKGISHPGPIYEFRELDIDRNAVQRINASPLLGRANNLKMFHNMLERFRSAKTKEELQYKMLLIKGEARQGKTRLLDEIVYTTPDDISVNRFTLTKTDQKIPYQAVRLIFNFPLSLNSDTSTAEKEEKLSKILNETKVYDLACALNEVFGVNFNKTKLYMSLTPQERHLVLRKMIKFLARVTFVTLWVLAIDDSEFIDNWSWQVFSVLFDVQNLFIVATIAQEKLYKSPLCTEVLDDPRVKEQQLKGIERWYLGALACQILDVYAISPEIENALQIRSNGNPGWIESFLISLIQDNALHILKATLQQIHDVGLVCPPLYMMARLTKEQSFKWQYVMEERTRSGNIGEPDYWQRYIDSCRDNFVNVIIREEIEAISQRGKVPICVIGPNFSISAQEMEVSIDAIILKTFDSLDFYEQLLVKCSAILGNQFLRGMLISVMSATNARKFAMAVQKLFEIRVLTCAKGDFLGNSTVFKARLLNPNQQTVVECQCIGIDIEEKCTDLPKYASCGYMQFRSSLFREITYNLLTDNQKKEFHQRAIRYLERETRKCKACGSELFGNIVSYKHDQEFLKARTKSKGGTKYATESASFANSNHSGSIMGYSGVSFSSISLGTSKKPRILFRKAINKVQKSHESFFGVAMVFKLKNSFSLTRAFSTEDFTDCQCNLILSTTYAQLIEQCKGAGDLDKLIRTMLEYANLCIILSNIPLALTILDGTLEVLKRKSLEPTENVWKFKLVRAKILILIGYAQMEIGHLYQAHDSLHLALNEYGIKFPSGLGRRMKTCAFKLRHILGLYVCPNTLLKNLDHWETLYANNLSECLSHLCTLYMIRDEWENAEMAATWSLAKCLESFSDFKVMSIACANMISVAQHYERWTMCTALEIYSLRLCHLRINDVRAEDLKCVAKLYAVIFTSRISQTHFQKAIHMGYVVLKLCISAHVPKIVLPMLPYLLHALLIGKHFNNVRVVLRDMHELANEDSNTMAKICYYAEALSLQIETGYTVVSFMKCKNYYQVEGACWLTSLYPDAGKRFCSVMWLWCMRKEQWEAALLWSKVMDDFLVVSHSDSLGNKCSALYVLEGLLLCLVSKLDRRNLQAARNIQKDINCLIKSLEKCSKSTKIILPRLYHLKAYYRYIIHNDSKVLSLLNKANFYAKKQDNLLEMEWIEHSTKAWNNELSHTVTEFWKEHSNEDDAIDFQDIEVTGTTGFFTLPTPLYH